MPKKNIKYLINKILSGYRELKSFYEKLNIKDIFLEFKEHITDFLNEKKDSFNSNENGAYLGKNFFNI